MQIKPFKKGATLLETLVYATLLSILTITTVAGLITLNNSLQGIVLGRIVDDAAQEVIEKIIREIRLADSVDVGSSILGVSPSKLVLNSTDLVGDPSSVELSIVSSTLEFSRDGSSIGPLTPNQVTIDEIIFDHIVTDRSEAVKVSLVLKANTRVVNIEETFNTTVILRGSY